LSVIQPPYVQLGPLHTRKEKRWIEITPFSLLSSRHQKREKSQSKADASGLFVVLSLLVIIGGLLIFIVVVVAGKRMRGTYTKSDQLSRSQRGIGVSNRWVDGDVWELKKGLIPLIVEKLLVVAHNPHLLLHHIHALICVTAHGEDTSEHFQHPRAL
jgi:hypothetical protein